MNPTELVKYIDHTLLKAQALPQDIEQLCQEAIEYGFYSVCVNSVYAPLAMRILSGHESKVCCVVGFPLGANLSQVKSHEARMCIDKGVTEIDMVANIAAIKQADERVFCQDIEFVKNVCHPQGVTLKVIVESCLLSEDELIWATKMVNKTGADFIKTSTGFSTGGATPEAVKIMKKHAASHLKIKASGGIRDINDAQNYIKLGASRLGTSSGVKIIQGIKSEGSY